MFAGSANRRISSPSGSAMSRKFRHESWVKDTLCSWLVQLHLPAPSYGVDTGRAVCQATRELTRARVIAGGRAPCIACSDRLVYNGGTGDVRSFSGASLMNGFDRRRTLRWNAFALLASAFLVSTTLADEPDFKPIFNGKDLTGWRVGKAVLAGKTADDDGRFAVKDGVLVITGSEGTSRRRSPRSRQSNRMTAISPSAWNSGPPGTRTAACTCAGQKFLASAPDPRLSPRRPLQDAQELPGRRLEHEIEVVVTGTKARCTCNGENTSRPLEIPDKRPSRPAIRDQRDRISQYPGQAGELDRRRRDSLRAPFMIGRSHLLRGPGSWPLTVQATTAPQARAAPP